ncbi:hypothetical protein Clacol_009774 [Clathrus columnatus]|uniref:FAD-binding PCMH-type domain-containing protein n=1 Tax=Clathrus columnatus TaxID=1419009 RepID=A0AAV5ALG7_9AGAM|nr:hypothetical protein Clacol_009774 [Clathrus columnatus]
MALGNLLTFYQLQVALTLLASFFHSPPVSPKCRSQLGDPLFPTINELSQFNDSIDGQLIAIVPSGSYCLSRGGCTEAEWTSSVFRSTIPGAMTNVNWEQNYSSDPNELCFRNSTICGAGNVPIFGVNASKPEHIQAGIEFARTRNLKLVVKSTGHDFLGRSTARNSFLLWTRNFRNITFHDSFEVGGQDMGSAVTVGSGVPLNMLYQAAKTNGKTFVGGTAGTVAPAGGYVQGAGHSALSPIYGLAADNVLEFHIVTPNGDLVTANTESHSDLFWALRGGGPGSWGVIVNATFRTFPILNASHQRTTIIVNNTQDVRTLTEIHAQHIFDWDDARAAQYFYWRAIHHTNGGASQYSFTIDTLFPNMSVPDSIASLEPMLGDFRDKGFNFTTSSVQTNINDILTVSTDLVGGEAVLASRFWSDDVYRNNVTDIGKAYQTLFDDGAAAILGHKLLGGRVSENANIDSAVHPGWRTAKTHMVITNTWKDTTSSIEVETLRNDLTKNKTPILASLAGPDDGSYSNEGDVREPEFQRVFYGRNYARLSSIKAHYDPHDLFIVPTGVGSERWDSAGLCKL